MNHHRHTHSPTVIRTKPGSPTVYPSRWDFTVLKGSTITDLVSSYCFLQESLAPKNVMFIYCLFICLLDFTYIYIYVYIYICIIYIYILYMFKVCFHKNLWTDPPTMKTPLSLSAALARSSVPPEATRTTPSKPSVSCRFPSRSTPIVRAIHGGIHGVMGRGLKTWKIWVWSDSVWNYRRILLCFFLNL